MSEPRKNRDFVKVDKAVLAQLRPMAEAAGVEIPGLIQHQPTIDLDMPVSDIGRQLGGLCARQPLFFRAGYLVALDDRGQLLPMTAERFGSWVEKFVTTVRWTKERGEHAATMSMDLAKRVMATDCFQVLIRELKFFFPVRLPVMRSDGDVVLLEPGYDEETCSWTEDGVEYDVGMGLDVAQGILRKYLGAWPYADRCMVEGGPWTLEGSRDASVIFAGMLGVFCGPMFGARSKRPMCVASGNQPGTGKTTLCKLMMAPVYGLPAEMSLPANEEKFDRLLESTALCMEPFLFLDDVGKMIRSNALNKFVTASEHGGTRLYTQQTFKVPNVTQVFVTGNDLPIEANLKRRVIWSELFLAGDVQNREFSYEITDAMLAKDEVRAELLGAMWAMVRYWAEVRGGMERSGRRVIKSFEVYCRIIGGVLESHGWADPFVEAPGISGGDSESREFQMLLVAAADTCVMTPTEFTVTQMVDLARSMNILEYFVGATGDGDLQKKERIRWGRKLAEYRGRTYKRTDGNFFQFGRRDGQGGSVYPCRIAAREQDL